jgi:hypothetical protein
MTVLLGLSGCVHGLFSTGAYTADCGGTGFSRGREGGGREGPSILGRGAPLASEDPSRSCNADNQGGDPTAEDPGREARLGDLDRSGTSDGAVEQPATCCS